ncbi:MAG: gliding motility-associated C-terminal domain-containing protein [Prevotellaceae bacterium]|nr:gliding motility-associated C-terminal domain-containing protein [Prevotellaceae bacterium]
MKALAKISVLAACVFAMRTAGAQYAVVGPALQSVSINPATQKYEVKFKPSPSDPALIDGYFILKYRNDGLNITMSDTMATLSNATAVFTDTAQACCTPQAYTVQVHTQQTAEPWNDPYRSMQQREPSVDSCKLQVALSWSPFQKLDKYDDGRFAPIPSFANHVTYHIFGYAGSHNFSMDSVQYLGTSNYDTAFVAPIVKEKLYHHFYIAAVYNNNQDTSTSNLQSVYVNLPLRPKYIGIDSVIGRPAATLVGYTIDTQTEYNRFVLEKADGSGTFFTVQEFSDKLSHTALDNALQNQQPAIYRIAAINSCGTTATSSPQISTLVPSISSNGAVNNITWNGISYQDFDAQQYKVYRTAPSEYAGLVDSTNSLFTADDLSVLPSEILGQAICYEVEATVFDTAGNIICLVRSADVCNSTEPVLYMPNAIQPSNNLTINTQTGKSRNLFEPVSAFDFTYTLTIYDRWGKEIYSGTTPWNGKINNTGEYVREGAYFYYLKALFSNGSVVEKKGNVMVVQ